MAAVRSARGGSAEASGFRASLVWVRAALGQPLRFGIVGVTSNALLYACYLLLTHLGAEPKLAATVSYALGIPVSFFGNYHWTFASRRPMGSQSIRYAAIYLLFYGVQIFGLYALVDLAGWRHQAGQAGLIIVIAASLFLLQKFWVFRRG